VRGEASLLEAALEGNGRAFADLVREHLPMMYRLAMRGCGDASLAEDAVQEALEIAYDKLAKYRAGTSLRSFLASIVVKRTYTLLRAEKRRRVREDASVVPQLMATPLEHVEAAALGESIRRVLENMPKKRRMAAMLRLDGGLDYTEISNSLGTSEGSARVLVHLALKELKVGLGTYLEGEGKDEE
jgi:RNA polymerase sigma-70 factor (ECF subfamily)